MKEFFRRPAVANTLKSLISFGFLAGLMYYVDIRMVISSFRNADPWYLTGGLFLAAVQMGLNIARWRYLLTIVVRDATVPDAATSFFVGFMAGFFTPAQVGEFAGRIASHPNVERSRIVGITIVDKLYWGGVTFILGGGGLLLFGLLYYNEYWNLPLGLLGCLLLIAIFYFSIVPEKALALLKRVPEKVRLHAMYETVRVIEDEFRNAEGRRAFVWTFLIYAAILLEYYLLAAAFGAVSFFPSLLSAASVFFVKSVILPISLGDLGVRESAAVFFFGRTGAPVEAAFNASLVMSFANVIIPTIIGALLIPRLRKR